LATIIREPGDVGLQHGERVDWAAAYRELRIALGRAGLLRPDPGAYGRIGAGCACLLLGTLALAAVGPHTAALAVVCMLGLGFGLVQVALLGHDAGHRSVFARPGPNRWLGRLCWSLVLGVGFAAWRRDHNAHHGRPNDPAADPAIQAGGLLALHEAAARTRPGWSRYLGGAQAVAYVAALPLLLLALRVQGWRYALGRLRGRGQAVEVALLSLNAVAWLGPPLVLGGWWAVVLLGAHLIGGVYLGLVFAPHHKGMPVWASQQPLSYLERQVLTARNVEGGWLCDVLFGGLNYQIEHHLFPTMPRSRLRQARDIVRPFCGGHGLSYEEVSAATSYGRVIAELTRVGSLARRPLDRAPSAQRPLDRPPSGAAEPLGL
jgi:fatty acid desaturase